MKIALVHEFLTQLGGAERVLENFLTIWPDATLHVLVYDKEKTQGIFEPFKKKLSWLQGMPMIRTHTRLYLAAMPKAVESFRFDDYDVVFSDSSSFAKGAKSADKLHICYCHTPTRFVWTETDYLKNQQYPSVIKWLGQGVLSWIKNWDFKAAQRPHFFIANSVNVKERIKKYYNRDSDVIYPPVDTEFFKPSGTKQDYFLVASRLEPYKKIDLVIELFNELGLPLKVAGSGTVAEQLKKTAKPNIEFLGRVSDDQLRRLYSEAKAYIFPAEEDAGIMMLEAQSCGTPVIAYGKGGALELVIEGVTGEFFAQQTSASLKQALDKFSVSKYDHTAIRQHALQFDSKFFRQKIKEYIEKKYLEFTKQS